MLTKTLFNQIFPTKGLDPRKYNLVRRRDELIASLNKFLPVYGINTYLRLCAFLSCCGIETDYFKTTEEYASGAAYEGRKDLGNTSEGDGRRFKGSSLIQTTGRYNFFRVLLRFVKKLTGKDYSRDPKTAVAEANRLGVNFLAHPEMLRNNIEIAVEAACIFWEENNLNRFADGRQIQELNGVVNRGDKNKLPLHWAKRNELYSVCRRTVPQDFSFNDAAVVIAPGTQLPAAAPPSPPVAANPQLPDVGVGQSEPAKEDSPDLNFDTAKQRYNDAAEVVKRPAVKGLLKVIVSKVVGYIVFVWETGLSGKLALILGALLAASSAGYAVYYYRVQIKSAYKKIKAAILKSFKGENKNEAA